MPPSPLAAVTLVAYIDPMSGSILLQVIVAALIGAVTMFRRAIWRVLRWPWRNGGRRADP